MKVGGLELAIVIALKLQKQEVGTRLAAMGLLVAI